MFPSAQGICLVTCLQNLRMGFLGELTVQALATAKTHCSPGQTHVQLSNLSCSQFPDISPVFKADSSRKQNHEQVTMKRWRQWTVSGFKVLLLYKKTYSQVQMQRNRSAPSKIPKYKFPERLNPLALPLRAATFISGILTIVAGYFLFIHLFI